MPPRDSFLFMSSLRNWFSSNNSSQSAVNSYQDRIPRFNSESETITHRESQRREIEEYFDNSTEQQRSSTNRNLSQIARNNERLQEEARRIQERENDLRRAEMYRINEERRAMTEIENQRRREEVEAANDFRRRSIERYNHEQRNQRQAELRQHFEDRGLDYSMMSAALQRQLQEELFEQTHVDPRRAARELGLNNLEERATNLQQGIEDWGHVYDQFGADWFKAEQLEKKEKGELALKAMKNELRKGGRELAPPVKSTSKRMQGPPPPPPDPIVKKQSNSRKIFILEE